MTSEQFAYWLQGFAELTDGAHPTPEQWKSIKEHLDTVFMKITPPVTAPRTVGPVFADPARHLTPLERCERGPLLGPFDLSKMTITC